MQADDDDMTLFVTVPLNEPEEIPMNSAAAMLVLDHMRIQRGEKAEEDPDVRRQLDAVTRVESGAGDADIPMILMQNPPPSAWDVKELERVIQSAYSAFVRYAGPKPGEDDWHTVRHTFPRPEWCLLEKLGRNGLYLFRLEARVNAPAYRIAHVSRDVNFLTRCQWDGADLKPVRLTHSRTGEVVMLPPVRRRCSPIIRPYSKKHQQQAMQKCGRAPMDRQLEIIETFVHPPVIAGVVVPGIATRRFLAVQWGEYNTSKREYMLLTSSIEDVPKDDAIFGCPAECVDVTGFAGMRLIVDRGNPAVTHVTMITAIDPHGNIPTVAVSWGRDKLLQRAQLIERVCQDDQFSAIYGKKKSPRKKI